MKKILLLVVLLFTATAYAQKTDSLINLIFKEKTDSARISRYYSFYYQLSDVNPVEVIEMQQEILAMAKKQKSRKLEIAATAELGCFFYISGSTVQGTRIILDALKKAEATNDPRLIGIAYQNLAVTSTEDEAKSRELYEKALSYSTVADDHFFACNELLGLAQFFYMRPAHRNLDSALHYAENAYQLALAKNDEVFQLFSLITLASIQGKLGNKDLVLGYIHTAERMPIMSSNRFFPTLIYNSYTDFYQITNQRDSALKYAHKSLEGVQGAFLSQEMKPVIALRQLYTGVNSDSALKYTNRYIFLMDSLQKTEAMQQNMALRFEEDLRQEKLEEERRHNLQYAAIAIGVVMLSILFLLLSHTTIATPRLIRFLGVVSLLIVFEFINLFIHPYLGELTHESPVMMLGFMVCLAALLVPLHHKIEHWLTHKMVEKNNRIRLAKAKKVVAHLEKKDSNLQTKE